MFCKSYLPLFQRFCLPILSSMQSIELVCKLLPFGLLYFAKRNEMICILPNELLEDYNDVLLISSYSVTRFVNTTRYSDDFLGVFYQMIFS